MILNHLTGELCNIAYVLYFSILKDFIDEQQLENDFNAELYKYNMATKQFYYRRTAPCLEKFPFCTHFSITDFQMCEKREQARSCSKREEECNMDFGDC